MPALEVRLWLQYLQTNPPNATEILLAQLLDATIKTYGGEKTKDMNIYTFAPWLEPPEVRKEREYQEKAARVQAVTAAYQREKGDGQS